MPSEPGPSSAVIAGGTSGVPGATGGGELAGAGMPRRRRRSSATGTPGRRCSVRKRTSKTDVRPRRPGRCRRGARRGGCRRTGSSSARWLGSSSGSTARIMVTVSGASGLTKAYQSVMSAVRSSAVTGASRWLAPLAVPSGTAASAIAPASAPARLVQRIMGYLLMAAAGTRGVRSRAVALLPDVAPGAAITARATIWIAGAAAAASARAATAGSRARDPAVRRRGSW